MAAPYPSTARPEPSAGGTVRLVGDLVRLQQSEATVDAVADAARRARGASSSSGSSTTPRSRRSRTSWRPTASVNPLGRNDFEGHVTKRIYALFAKTRGFDELATDPLLLGVLDRGARALPAQRPGGHRHRPGRDAAGAAPRRRRVPDPVAAPAGGAQHDVGARRLHRGQRRHPHRARAAIARHRPTSRPIEDADRRRRCRRAA